MTTVGPIRGKPPEAHVRVESKAHTGFGSPEVTVRSSIAESAGGGGEGRSRERFEGATADYLDRWWGRAKGWERSSEESGGLCGAASVEVAEEREDMDEPGRRAGGKSQEPPISESLEPCMATGVTVCALTTQRSFERRGGSRSLICLSLRETREPRARIRSYSPAANGALSLGMDRPNLGTVVVVVVVWELAGKLPNSDNRKSSRSEVLLDMLSQYGPLLLSPRSLAFLFLTSQVVYSSS